MASIEDIAREVIAGKWGSGADRVTALTNAGYNASDVQSKVNSMMYGNATSPTPVATPTTTPATTPTNNATKSTSTTGDIKTQIDNIAQQIASYSSNNTNKAQGYLNQLIKNSNNTYTPQYSDKIEGMLNDIGNLTSKQFKDKYGATKDSLAKEIANSKFEYDPESDATYQQYKDAYTRMGQQAMEDTLGTVSARTGGLASSYAGVASQSAYNNYMQQLADKIPELKQLAYQMYQGDLQNKQNAFNNYNALSDTEYSRWANDQNTKINGLLSQITGYNNLENTNYGMWNDAQNRKDSATTTALQTMLNLDEAGFNKLVSKLGALTNYDQYKNPTVKATGGSGGGNPTSNDPVADIVKQGINGFTSGVTSSLNGTPAPSETTSKSTDYTPYQVLNSKTDNGVQIEGLGNVTWSQLEQLVNMGKVKEEVSHGKVRYSVAQ